MFQSHIPPDHPVLVRGWVHLSGRGLCSSLAQEKEKAQVTSLSWLRDGGHSWHHSTCYVASSPCGLWRSQGICSQATQDFWGQCNGERLTMLREPQKWSVRNQTMAFPILFVLSHLTLYQATRTAENARASRALSLCIWGSSGAKYNPSVLRSMHSSLCSQSSE